MTFYFRGKLCSNFFYSYLLKFSLGALIFRTGAMGALKCASYVWARLKAGF